MSEPLKVALYARVSTKDQDTTAQKDRLFNEAQLRGWAVLGYFEDHGVSGKDDNRPAFKEALKLAGIEKNKVVKAKIDAIIVTKLDRMMRSLTHLENTINILEKQEVKIICIDQGIETLSNDMSQRLIRQILGAVAEWERDIIISRVNDGVAKAKKHGTKSGKPFGRPKREIPPEALKEIEEGLSLRQASKKYNIPLSTLSERINGRKDRSENNPLEEPPCFIYQCGKNEASSKLKDCEQSKEGTL